MKIEYEKNMTNKIPNVGECWKEDGRGAVYLRVDDMLASHHSEYEKLDNKDFYDYFYSIDLGNPTGLTIKSRKCTDIIILNAKIVIGEADATN